MSHWAKDGRKRNEALPQVREGDNREHGQANAANLNSQRTTPFACGQFLLGHILTVLEYLNKVWVAHHMDISKFEVVMLDGATRSLKDFAGKVTLIVNVASRCGLTPQYGALEALHEKYHSRGFNVLGMPSNQFMQELSSSDEIAEFCSTTWGVTFPMTEKIKVNGRNRHALYKELVKTKDQAGLAGPVLWNFEKFLILPSGEVHRFRPTTKPDDEAIVALIEANLPS